MCEEMTNKTRMEWVTTLSLSNILWRGVDVLRRSTLHSNYNIQIFEELAVASIDLRREKSNSVDTHHKFGNLFNTYSTTDR